ncbi:sensor histidine kinase [Pseudogemmobacter sp. W21_MBD1_M6]|uniref:sensor histidine kinase n=1 Tax=Pseudogemmobacter sp. W21_MBD1_M6 TaxID=3240271 RepID=UPI003F98962C
MTRLALALCFYIFTVAAFAGGVWWFAYSAALDQLADRGRSDLSLASDRLMQQLSQYRELAVLLSDHPTLVPLARGEGGSVPEAASLLLRTADKTGSLEIFLASAAGKVLASSTGAEVNHRELPYFRRAMHGATGTFHAQDIDSGARVFTFAAPIFDASGRTTGAVGVRVDVSRVEGDWIGDPDSVFFTDGLGVIFVSNRTELLLRTRNDGSAVGRGGVTAEYDPTTLRPFIDHELTDFQGLSIWSLDAGPYLPERALHLMKPLPLIEMTGEVLIDVAPAERVARLQAAFAAALLMAFGAMLFTVMQRRRALAEQLLVEADLKAALELRVQERTAELSEVNENLRREVAERQDAEAALKKAQADLVQAGKLSALGQMSAGISHELNQPLMAIRSFAENAEIFLERGKTDIAAQNLTRISELARRMGRIIKNLRAFARQESEPMVRVNLGAVVDAVLEMSEARLDRADVTVDWAAPPVPVLVRGGEVRLQQVILNLVSNAIDAMEGSAGKRLEIKVEQAGARATVQVRDTGPGIAAPDKIFDPFYSTKAVGAGEGMGLGLSISYGLVQSFGGAIRGRNAEGGGAVFTVELATAPIEKAA